MPKSNLRLNTELENTQLLVLLPFLIDTIEDKKPFHIVLNEYRTQLRDMALENGAEIVDLQEVFDKTKKEISPVKLSVDGVHPTDLGHSVIAQAVLECFE